MPRNRFGTISITKRPQRTYERHIKLAKTLHADNDMWATGKSLYWQGLLPKHFAYVEEYKYMYK